MGNWHLIKHLAKGTGFYTKQFIFFSIIGLLAFIIGLSITHQRYKADENYQLNETAKTLTQNINLTVKSNGRIIRDGKNIGLVELYNDSDIVRIKVIDRPDTFINLLQTTVRFESNLPSGQINHKPIATHYTSDESSAVSSYIKGTHTIVYTGNYLGPDTIYTIYAKLPKGVIHPPLTRSLAAYIIHLPFSFWLILSFSLPFLTLLLFLILLIRRAFSQRLPSSPPVSKPPEDVPPAVLGVLIHGRIGPREIAATLLDLAERNYLHIYEKGSEFNFGRGRELESDGVYRLLPFEKLLLSKIFPATNAKSSDKEINLRLGQQLFSQKIAQVFLEIYNSVEKYGYFIQNPGLVRQKYKITGLTVFFTALAGFTLSAVFNSKAPFLLLFWLGMIIVSVLIISFNPGRPPLTHKGKIARRAWLGFRRYLKTQKTQTYKEEVELPYTEYLPYAIVLDVETDWTKHFCQTPFSNPSWFGSNQQIASIEDFANSLFPLIAYISRNLIISHSPIID